MFLSVFRLVCVIAALLPLTACRTKDLIDQAVDQIDKSTATVQGESQAWRTTLPSLATDLETLARNAQGEANADAKTLVANTGNEIRSLTNDTVKMASLSSQDLVASFGTEAKCITDFFRSRVLDDLNTLKDKLLYWKSHNKMLPPPPPHSVCHVNPSTIELHPIGMEDRWSLDFPPNKIIGVYGYNFRVDMLPQVEVQTSSGERLRMSKVRPAYVTRYQIDLDFAEEDFSRMAPGVRFVLQWPDQPDPNTITAQLKRPAELNFVGEIKYEPISPRARTSLVRPTITIANQGGSNSGSFTILWKPGPNEQLQSLEVPNLSPGQSLQVTFNGYAYPNDGTFTSVVSISTGSDRREDVLMVSPYANVAHEFSIPIQDSWPNGGGERDQTRSFGPFVIQSLPSECVLDTTRGGGTIRITDPDDKSNEAKAYNVVWPQGFQFDFPGNTIWGSFHQFQATYDAQQREARATVELRGLGGHGIFAKRGSERFNGTFTVYLRCPQ